MKILAIDDSPPVLDVLTEAIREACPNAQVFAFDDPYKLLDFAKETPCDIAFLDIQMPGMNGLEAAIALKKIKPSLNIIFVTAYSQYAIEAMKLYPSGYVMKPVIKEAIEREIENLRHPVEQKSDKKIRVQCFGNFEVFADGKPLNFTRSKTKELFAYIISRKGALCSNNEIIAAIWEDKNDSVSLQSHYRHLVADLIKTLKSLKAEDVLIKKWKHLAVIPDKLLCDLYEMNKGNVNVLNSFHGEIMSQYSWAEVYNIKK